MRKEEFTFDSRDGIHKLYAVRYLPEGKPKAIVQIVHGMSEYVARYEDFAAFLTERGFLVTGEDHLGHGKSVPDGETYGYICSQDPATVMVRDVHRLKKMNQEKYPGVPYFILGHSMGSYILRNYMFRYGTGIQGAIILGTGYENQTSVNFARGLTKCIQTIYGQKHLSHLLDKLVFGKYNEKITNPRTPSDWLSKDEEVVNRYRIDPLCGFSFTVNGYGTLFELLNRLYDKENLAKLPEKLPVLMASGDEDPVGAYGEGVKRAFESLKESGMKNVEMKLYPGDRHEILNELDKDQVMKDIAGWIEKSLGE
ncbi:MAG: alpha/beta hydrolase [Lachnospiraceae bacterium]|nr:alpha/beta hydrolase [Lachnospiraceae bacterium]